MSYRLTEGDVVVRIEDGAFIPDDPGNRDRQAFEKWCAEGHTPAAAEGPTLEQVKAQALMEIDRLGGQQRLLYITDIPGQEGTYIAKQTEALAWAAAGSPTTGLVPGTYIYAEAEAALTGDTVAATLASYLAKSAALNGINAQIEAVRVNTRRQVNAATEREVVYGIVNALEWPSP